MRRKRREQNGSGRGPGSGQKKMEQYIKEMLEEYTGRELSPWHMPGHKRHPVHGGVLDEMFRLDVTEVPGTDDLHHAEGAIRRSQEAAAECVDAAYSHYLVGGATAGILAAIAATAKMRKRMDLPPVYLVAGNCHKSVWNGLKLVQAEIRVLEPEGDPQYGPVRSDAVLNAIDETEDTEQIAGCILTSPTYVGCISPLGEISAVLKVFGIPLIVDEAHGAHFPFCSELEWMSGVSNGAEYVIQSLHKTLPAMTQTAILHVGGDDDPTSDALDRAVSEELKVFQSSSPSYLLMLSAEAAVAWADENRDAFDTYIGKMQEFREKIGTSLNTLELVELPGEQDPTRLFFRIGKNCKPKTAGDPLFTGTGMAEWLERETGVVVELAGSSELILISTVCDGDEDLDNLADALGKLDEKLTEKKRKPRTGRGTRRKKASVADENAEDGFEWSQADAGSGSGSSGAAWADTGAGSGSSGADREGTGSGSGGTGPEKEEGPAGLQNPHVRLPQVGAFIQRDIYVYPPGIPIIRSGERVSEAALEKLKDELAAGRRIYGLD